VHLEKVFSLLGSLKNESKRVEILQKLFLYIFSVRELEPTEISKVLSHSRINRDYEDLAMTTAERLRQEGKIEGKVEGKIETARNMLLDGASLEYILKITGLTEQDLKDCGLL
ncbi:Rpn family recombination-promoting nuclease/putative transposase, partial [Leptospira santarosai]